MSTRRVFVAEVRAVSDGTTELSFSSDQPVEVGGVREVLSHAPNAADLSRINTAGPVLFEHDRERVIGLIESARIDGNRGRARIRWGTTALALEVARDVAAGIRRNVSVGYRILKAEIVNGIRLVTKWEALEISVVSIPADTSVGFGRSHSPNPSPAQQPHTPVRELKNLKDKRGALMKELNGIVNRSDDSQITAEHQTRAAAIQAEVTILDGKIMVANNELAGAARSGCSDEGNSNQSGPDLANYSLVRALRLASQGRSLDGLEGEVHQELSRSAHEAPRGVLIPLGSLRQRTLSVTGGEGGEEGGVTVATGKGDLIDYLRSALTLRGLGATVLTGLTGDLDLPRVNAATNATWKAENAALSQSSPTMGQLEMRPKRLGTFTEISRQLLIQSSLDIEQWVRMDLANAIAGAWEFAAIAGTGDNNQPRGILNTSNIGDVVGGTDGLAPTWAKIVELENKVADVDAALGSLGYLTNTKVRGKLKTTLRNPSGTDATYIWPDDSRLNGYTTAVSNHVPSNLTKGSAEDICSAIIFGNFADLVLAQWGAAADIIVNPYIKDTEGLVRITAATFVDVGIRRASSFAAFQDALTAA